MILAIGMKAGDTYVFWRTFQAIGLKKCGEEPMIQFNRFHRHIFRVEKGETGREGNLYRNDFS